MSENFIDRMQRWQCHKVVRAAKILVVGRSAAMAARPADVHPDAMLIEGDIWVLPSPGMFARYRPVPGDYYVVYGDDQYRSISPTKEFEDGYAVIVGEVA